MRSAVCTGGERDEERKGEEGVGREKEMKGGRVREEDRRVREEGRER